MPFEKGMQWLCCFALDPGLLTSDEDEQSEDCEAEAEGFYQKPQASKRASTNLPLINPSFKLISENQSSSNAVETIQKPHHRRKFYAAKVKKANGAQGNSKLPLTCVKPGNFASTPSNSSADYYPSSPFLPSTTTQEALQPRYTTREITSFVLKRFPELCRNRIKESIIEFRWEFLDYSLDKTEYIEWYCGWWAM
ncbi:uncharacterized protein Bfra_006262 [Botrytis fragariae]|uniref:Uncharacterized protein n=1 Tax=Botrytis fragariae TaxID=1964551 RepID=A0A8H6B4L5_9HELO|nr:uncharacterized protein Bfra_006262 [Botrytis fragariae]KAF5879058.1 hypothetical protein Bfra_006262 [Botrytis fragariae]